MRVTSKLLALALTAVLQPAFAATVPLSFDDITKLDGGGNGWVQLLDRYSDDKHIQFTGDAWGVASYTCGGIYPIAAHGGSCGALVLGSDPGDQDTGSDLSFTLNFTDGFVGGSSFFYSALSSDITIVLFEGLNGTGASTTVSGLNAADCGITDVLFCNWAKLTLDFKGTAHSIVISAKTDETFALDDLSLVQAAATNPNPLPEPGSIALAMGALGAMGWTRRRVSR
jgi:hypothetical protein